LFAAMLEGIKHIIFDLGGVILPIDYSRTTQAFRDLGITNFDELYSQAAQTGKFDDFETGKLSEKEFINFLKNYVPDHIQTEELETAWNAMLLDWIPERLELIMSISKHFNTYLYSNTNSIHQRAFLQSLKEQIGVRTLEPYFDTIYYSHEFGYRKPHPESFERILINHNLLASETLFLDDSLQHIEGARQLGIRTIHVQERDIIQLFS
jgi:glucose-1-phosphatase